jgi:hypothetical protein
MSRQGFTAQLLKEDIKTHQLSEPELPHTLQLITDSGLSAEHSEAEKPAQPPLVPTVFHEEWWLDAATGGRYSIAEVQAGNKTVGRLPYLVRSRFGLKGIWTPPVTYFLGPGLDEGEGSPNNRFLKRMDITRELIAKLPKSSWECIRCHAGIKDMIAFQEQRFRTYVQFTHEISPAPTELLWQQLRNKTRNVIRRAREQMTIEEIGDPEEFIRAHKNNLAAEGESDSLDMDACRKVLTSALAHKQGRIIASRDAEGKITAANFCAWDNATSYYVLSTRSRDAGNGATSLLIWEAIQQAVSRGLTFDFAGLGTKGSVLLYSGFGATVAPRFVALRSSGFARLIADARALLTNEFYFF